MSQEQAKIYLAAAEKAQAAANAALPALASADAALKSALGARAVLQKTLQNTTDSAQKAVLAAEIKQFDATVLNPAKTAFNVAKFNVDNPLRSAQELREQANRASDSSNDSINITPLGDLAAQDARDYPAPDPYFPNEGASGPANIETENAARTIPLATGGQIPTLIPAPSLTSNALPPPRSSSLVPIIGLPTSTPTTTVVTTERSVSQEPRPFVTGQTSPAAAQQQLNNDDPQNITTSENQQTRVSEAPVVIAQPRSAEDIRRRAQQSVNEPTSARLNNDTTSRSQQEIDAEELAALQQAQQQQEFFANSQEFFANINGGTSQARKSSDATAVSVSNAKDLRVRISLAEKATYFYNADTKGILRPLAATNGVIFPYTPQITINYSAAYDAVEPTHSNYKIYNYKASAVDSISIIGEFTAQDTEEANYLLAVIHFFKTVTKMFYGNDVNPVKGAPPPLCYLSGYGAYAFDRHPIVISSFSLSYPNDVNYINAGASLVQGQQLTEYTKPIFPQQRGILARIAGLKRTGVAPGGVSSKTPFTTVSDYEGITRVPTKITITLTALPMITRNEMSNYFSLKDYATGALLKNSRGYGGMW